MLNKKQSAQANLRCFVAMALKERRADTEQIYSKKIKPLLRSMGIRVVRIDEIEHLDNIDQRILREIEKSHFMVADLTYERPSVYFEAGYAERKPVPVIYTCRTDHLSPTAPESPRVHFDIRQRPIVKWESFLDETFSGRLKRKIVRLIVPLISARLQGLKTKKAEEDFVRLSLTARCTELIRASKKVVSKLGYRNTTTFQLGDETGWVGYRGAAKGIHRLLILTSPCTKVELKRITRFTAPLIFQKLPLTGNANEGTDHVVLLCFGSVPSSRIELVLHDYTKIDHDGGRTWQKLEEGRLIKIHLLDRLRSIGPFEKAIRVAIK